MLPVALCGLVACSDDKDEENGNKRVKRTN